MSSIFTHLLNKSISSYQISANEIKSIKNRLDPNYPHGHDMISIRMIKLRGDSTYKPLEKSTTKKMLM